MPYKRTSGTVTFQFVDRGMCIERVCHSFSCDRFFGSRMSGLIDKLTRSSYLPPPPVSHSLTWAQMRRYSCRASCSNNQRFVGRDAPWPGMGIVGADRFSFLHFNQMSLVYRVARHVVDYLLLATKSEIPMFPLGSKAATVSAPQPAEHGN